MPDRMLKLETGRELAVADEVPQGKDQDSAEGQVPCPQCHRMVLMAHIGRNGQDVVVWLDTDQTRQKTYCASWDREKRRYGVYESAAYPVHRCPVLAPEALAKQLILALREEGFDAFRRGGAEDISGAVYPILVRVVRQAEAQR